MPLCRRVGSGDPVRLPTGWISGHHVHRRTTRLGALLLLAAALDVAAGVGLAYVAGFAAVDDALHRVSWPWLVGLAVSIAVSFAGYFVAYRGIYQVEDGPRLSPGQMWSVVMSGFGGFLAHGGSALDDYALRAAGADDRDSRVRVSALAGMEHGVLGILGTGAAITVLAQGLSQPPGDFTIPWAVIPIPGFAIAFWLAERYRARLNREHGWRGRLGVFLDSIHLNRELFLRPRAHGPAVLGMAVFWLAEAFAVWAGLAAFGSWMNAAALFIGYGTGMVFTRRTGPLAGSGVLMVVLPVTLWYSGGQMAAAVAGVFAYRIVSVWLPMPFAIASLPTLRRMGKHEGPKERPSETSDEPALRRKSA